MPLCRGAEAGWQGPGASWGGSLADSHMALGQGGRATRPLVLPRQVRLKGGQGWQKEPEG